ncbi:hypothetical protein ACFQ2M_00030 [Kitasatospora saccharophila]|uniref:hypothetical protein n=1 Tax=Kitasatospora saccharophila TaxID=407973 RepID=UPI003627158D
MPRPENPIDPNAPEPIREIAAGLREARAQAGNPDYRSMGKRANYSSTALSQAASGKKFPSLSLTLAYLESLQVGPEVLDEWERRWTQAKQDLASIPAPAPTRIETITVTSQGTMRPRDSAELVRPRTSPAAQATMFRLPGFGMITTRGDWSRAMYWLRHRNPADVGRKMSMGHIAASSGVPMALIPAMLTGERIPRPAILQEVLRAMGATPAECQVLLYAAEHLHTVRLGPDYTNGLVSDVFEEGGSRCESPPA